MTKPSERINKILLELMKKAGKEHDGSHLYECLAICQYLDEEWEKLNTFQICSNCGKPFNNPLADICGNCFANV